ncbi:MAG TPA: hypothetical protein VFD82_06130 [Planctomycetota bacterium]|nr:hypothetical protein [Planctomycetota bacterium]
MIPRPVLCLVSALALCPGDAPAAVPALRLCPEFQTQDPPKPKTPVDLQAEREKLRETDVLAWKKLPVKSMAEVVDPKKESEPLEIPDSVTAEEKAKMEELMKKAKDGAGAKADRALREFEKMGYPALLFIINQLREIDYKNTDAALWGMRLNTTLMNITMGVHTGYVAVDLGEEMDPRKAQWNAKTVREWVNAVKKEWPTREKFDEFITKRKAKKEAELEGGGEKKADPPKGK